eukprot:NODE_3270_length_685_cov_320.559748_g2325_i0.p1 GENE.NODE_3270_length_685_cov_320.559748_g2325_i0~~NODE_3270_length_685_cov_320.559748_g2325_i0.p1  ORF type:complete len:224 (+),score=65.12 NODE_3270_length_685_cov_320.559748_g2325_i0:58-672(+)
MDRRHIFVLLICLSSAAIAAGSPTVLGCFFDRVDRDLPVHLPGVSGSHEICAAACAARGYQYAGCQHSDQCFCGNSYNRWGERPTAECSMSCSMNSAQKCGGVWRSTILTATPSGARDCSFLPATANSGLYLLPTGQTAYCDMEHDGGHWTLALDLVSDPGAVDLFKYNQATNLAPDISNGQSFNYGIGMDTIGALMGFCLRPP